MPVYYHANYCKVAQAPVHCHRYVLKQMFNYYYYFRNKAKIRDRPIVVLIIVMETSLFDCWYDNSSFEALW